MEKRYAIIKDEICDNIIVIDSSNTEFAVEIGAVELPDDHCRGDLFDGSVWTKKEREQPEPEPEIPSNEELQAQVLTLAAAMADMYEGLVR